MADFLLPNLEDLLDEATGVLPFGPSEDIDCSICRENFVITDANHLNAPIRLPCSGQHLVCRLCLKEWLLECIRGDLPGTCTFCREVICRDFSLDSLEPVAEMTMSEAEFARWRSEAGRRGDVLRTRVYTSDSDGALVAVVDFVEYDSDETKKIQTSDFEEDESGPDKSDVQDDDPNDSDFVADSLSEDSGDESDSEADGGVALAEA
ncbi:hypothetical protein EV356DRAFT_513839 [Viridothelium virens]|uniref:RING-type domain-containing protein n=1 Tax=Viridothelium virens TaxID=1048519 RepID=A0A6A6HN35_VIRVR|nr:hypothetical protein EV356DRAFT_513839 [Viridothelium virens]